MGQFGWAALTEGRGKILRAREVVGLLRAPVLVSRCGGKRELDGVGTAPIHRDLHI